MERQKLSIYDRAQAEHGCTPQGFMWHSAAVAQIYYQVTLMVTKWSGQSCLEVGCGAGSMWEYVCEKGYDMDYEGIDINQSAILEAKKKYTDLNFYSGDILTFLPLKSYEFCLAAGAFNIKNDHVDDHQAYLRAVIEKMFTICKKGMAISFKTLLSDEGKARGYMAYDPVDILEHALTLSRFANLNHAFSDGFAVLYLYK